MCNVPAQVISPGEALYSLYLIPNKGLFDDDAKYKLTSYRRGKTF